MTSHRDVIESLCWARSPDGLDCLLDADHVTPHDGGNGIYWTAGGLTHDQGLEALEKRLKPNAVTVSIVNPEFPPVEAIRRWLGESDLT